MVLTSPMCLRSGSEAHANINHSSRAVRGGKKNLDTSSITAVQHSRICGS